MVVQVTPKWIPYQGKKKKKLLGTGQKSSTNVSLVKQELEGRELGVFGNSTALPAQAAPEPPLTLHEHGTSIKYKEIDTNLCL